MTLKRFRSSFLNIQIKHLDGPSELNVLFTTNFLLPFHFAYLLFIQSMHKDYEYGAYVLMYEAWAVINSSQA